MDGRRVEGRAEDALDCPDPTPWCWQRHGFRQCTEPRPEAGALTGQFKNWVRLNTLIVDTAAKYLRLVLADCWEKVRGSPWDAASGEVCWDQLLSKASKKDVAHLEERIKAGDPKTWDITLLTRLIMGLFKREEAVVPSQRRLDWAVKERVERLSRLRNACMHPGHAGLSDEAFRLRWSELCETLRFLSAAVGASDGLDDECAAVHCLFDGVGEGARLLEEQRERLLQQQLEELVQARAIHDAFERERANPLDRVLGFRWSDKLWS